MNQIPLFPESASTLAPEVDRLYFFGVVIAVVFSLFVAALVIGLGVKYRRRNAEDVGSPEKASMWLEITWSVIPLAILLFMFAWGAIVFFKAMRPPADAVQYWAVGKQWMWKIQHPAGNREINELHVPINVPIKLTMTSEDVIHSFFVPAFRIKMDVLPGRYTTVWFEATKPGTYTLFCTEYCGAEHSRMIGKVVALEPADYERWLAGGATLATGERTGEEIFAASACGTCHRSDSAAQGPILNGIFGHEVEMADGSTVMVDEDYLRESILNPGAKLVKGFNPLMPTYQGQLSEEDLVQLIIYIKNLPAPDGSHSGDAP